MIIYASRTGNVKSIVDKMGVEAVKIEAETKATKPYILFTYTDGLGSIPKKVDDFLQENYQLCLGVFASGNKNFGVNNFAGSADKIRAKYGIPTLYKVEVRGYQKDIDNMLVLYKERVMTNDKQVSSVE